MDQFVVAVDLMVDLMNLNNLVNFVAVEIPVTVVDEVMYYHQLEDNNKIDLRSVVAVVLTSMVESVVEVGIVEVEIVEAVVVEIVVAEVDVEIEIVATGFEDFDSIVVDVVAVVEARAKYVIDSIKYYLVVIVVAVEGIVVIVQVIEVIAIVETDLVAVIEIVEVDEIAVVVEVAIKIVEADADVEKLIHSN